MNKKYSIVLIAILVITALIVGCSNAPGTTAPAKDQVFTIGYNNLGQGVPALDLIEAEGRYVNTVLGNKFTVVNNEFQADKLQKDIQSLISSGVHGIMLFGWVPTAIPGISDMCQQAKIPFVIFDQIPRDEEQKAYLSKNPYYVGSVGIDNTTSAANIAKIAAEKYKTALIIGGAVGDIVHDARFAGFRQAFEKAGGTILGEAHCSDPSEATAKGEDLLAAHPEAECIYALTGDFATGMITALGNKKLEIPIFASDIVAASLEDINSGKIEVGQGGCSIATSMAAVLLQNYLDGHSIKTPEGQAPYFGNIVLFEVRAKDTADYKKYFVDGNPFTEDQIKSLSYRYNEKVDYSTYMDFIKNYSIDMLNEAHK
ncbi:MAG: sugar ABC transporter substrate-binding protein [Saccharofermentanales bacterium]|jgi:ABC-type sugar transport system substrate-binding protein